MLSIIKMSFVIQSNEVSSSKTEYAKYYLCMDCKNKVYQNWILHRELCPSKKVSPQSQTTSSEVEELEGELEGEYHGTTPNTK